MKMSGLKGMGMALVLAAGLSAWAADADKPATPAIASDGSLLNETFDGTKLPAGWDLHAGGGNRRDVTLKDGRLIFNPGKGDNNVLLPKLPINLDEDFVIEITFVMPEPTKNGYTLLSLNREGGYFQIIIADAEGTRRVVMNRGANWFGPIEAGKPYIFALMCRPDGACKGTLTGPGIAKPSIQTVPGPDGIIKEVALGNVFSDGVGSLHIDSIKVGKPAR